MNVTRLFPFVDQNELIIHVDSFDWDFRNFGPVELKLGSDVIHCRYIGSGTSSNEAVLRLAPNDPQYTNVAAIAKKYGNFKGPVSIERSSSMTQR